MVEIAVIADDLTGAADTGIQFRPVYADTVLMADTALAADCRMPRPDVLAVHTATRAASPEDARRRIGETAKRLRQLEPRRVYKKVDSCLRGNLGAETEALLDLVVQSPAVACNGIVINDPGKTAFLSLNRPWKSDDRNGRYQRKGRTNLPMYQSHERPVGLLGPMGGPELALTHFKAHCQTQG